MSKAVLVMDMPRNCCECSITCKLRHQIDVGLIKNTCRDGIDGRLEWCPLRPLPEKKEPTRIPISPILPWEYTDYEKGWNECLDEITGGINETV